MFLFQIRSYECVFLPFSEGILLNTVIGEQLNVLELFLDCMTEPNEKLIEFGVGGICNSCVGAIWNLTHRVSYFDTHLI